MPRSSRRSPLSKDRFSGRPVSRRDLSLGLGAAAAAPFAAPLLGASPLGAPALAQTRPSDEAIDQAVRALFRVDPARRDDAWEVIDAYDDPDLAASLILALRFAPRPRGRIQQTLARLTGDADRRGWFDWMLWQEAHPEITPHPTFRRLKVDMFLSIDRNFAIFLRDEHLEPERMRIRLEEITWGGVPKDGIPSLDRPAMISADAADYLRDDDLVFGVAVNGDVRAYPLRIMGWHEMFNDVVGGVPLALAYCTLCGAGILFETAVDGREAPFVFGSSGFLYRSNKLMFDRETHSLWNQFTGEPVVGPLVDSGVTLRQRPVVVTPWGRWRARNPQTKALSLDTGHARDYGSGVVYRDYFASDDLMFPTIVDQTRLAQKDYVFGVRTVGAAKAWPIGAFDGGRLINDRVGALNLVLIGETAGRTVRAYDRGDRVFARAPNGEVTVDGAVWRQTEDALVGPNGETAPRVAGHIAYWFAWAGYLGVASELYSE